MKRFALFSRLITVALCLMAVSLVTAPVTVSAAPEVNYTFENGVLNATAGNEKTLLEHEKTGSFLGGDYTSNTKITSGYEGNLKAGKDGLEIDAEWNLIKIQQYAVRRHEGLALRDGRLNI